MIPMDGPAFRLCQTALAATLIVFVALAGSSAGDDSASVENSLIPKVRITTSMGVVDVELDAAKAPRSVKNFLAYVKSGFYDGTVFHRVVKDFMIQGGGRTADLKKKETERPIRNEAGNGLKNSEYTIAMARLQGAHTATSQFFINTENNTSLNRDQARDGIGYAVFGRVIKGQDVVDKIESTKTHGVSDPDFPQMTMEDVPVDTILIESIEVLPDENEAE